MRIPDALAPLFDYGLVEEVLRPLMSGKEAQIYLVVAGGTECVAKVYKEAENRTFKHRAEYTEGRKVRSSRDQRAMGKRSKHGRAQDEAAWRSTEVDVIHRLHAAGVRVPVPMHFVEGVFLMELVTDAHGQPAPRLADLGFEPEAAQAIFDRLIGEVAKMLSAGVVHGDLSDFNVLVGANGPVIIDFPQAVGAAENANARKLLVRDVDNLHRFLARFSPTARRLPYAEEMWELFEHNALTPDTRLTGRYRPAQRRANTSEVLDLIREADDDERKRRDAVGRRGGAPARGGEAQVRGGPRSPSPSGGARHEAPRQGPPHQGGARHEAPRQGPPRQGGARHEAPRQGPPHQGGARQAPQHGPRRQDAPHREAPRHEPERQGSQHSGRAGDAPPARSRSRTEDAPARGPRAGGPDGQRRVRRQVEVIVVRKPQ